MNDNVWEILDPNSAEGLMAQLERMLTSLGSSIPEPHSGTIFDDSNGIIHIHPGAKIGPGTKLKVQHSSVKMPRFGKVPMSERVRGFVHEL